MSAIIFGFIFLSILGAEVYLANNKETRLAFSCLAAFFANLDEENQFLDYAFLFALPKSGMIGSLPILFSQTRKMMYY